MVGTRKTGKNRKNVEKATCNWDFRRFFSMKRLLTEKNSNLERTDLPERSINLWSLTLSVPSVGRGRLGFPKAVF